MEYCVRARRDVKKLTEAQEHGLMCLTVGRGRGTIGMINISGVLVVRSAWQNDETVMMVMNEVQ